MTDSRSGTPHAAPRRDRDGLLLRAYRLDSPEGRRAWRTLVPNGVEVIATMPADNGRPPMALLATDGRDDLAPWWDERVTGAGQNEDQAFCVDMDLFTAPGQPTLTLLTLRTTIRARLDGQVHTLGVTFDLGNQPHCDALAAAAAAEIGAIELVREQDKDADDFKGLELSLGASGMAAVRRALRVHWLTQGVRGLANAVTAGTIAPGATLIASDVEAAANLYDAADALSYVAGGTTQPMTVSLN